MLAVNRTWPYVSREKLTRLWEQKSARRRSIQLSFVTATIEVQIHNKWGKEIKHKDRNLKENRRGVSAWWTRDTSKPYLQQVTFAHTLSLVWCIWGFSSDLTGNTLHLHNKDQLVNVVWGNNRCLVWKSYETHKYPSLVKWGANINAGGAYIYHSVLKG
jgi:hypothetical protein